MAAEELVTSSVPALHVLQLVHIKFDVQIVPLFVVPFRIWSVMGVAVYAVGMTSPVANLTDMVTLFVVGWAMK